jgi:serine/threonine protein kinase
MGESPEVPDGLSKEGAEFLEMCFEHDPRQRATATDLLSHPFLKVF